MKSIVIASALVCSIGPAVADVQASFLGTATYATRGGCVQLKKLAAGTQRNLTTVPETLDAKGFMSWEGGCTIDKIIERVAGKTWTVNLKCSEGEIENAKSTETWTKMPDGSILARSPDRNTRFYKCAVGAKR